MSDYKINFDWVSDISLDGDKIVITGKRSKDWDAPEYIVKFKLEQWHLRLLVGIPSGLASKRAKEALDFKQKLIEIAQEGTKWTKESRNSLDILIVGLYIYIA